MKNSLFLFVLLFLVSCSSALKKEIRQEKAQVDLPEEQGAVYHRGQNIVEASPNLTTEQKEKILALQDETFQKVQHHNDEIKRLKVVLFKTLSDPEYSNRKMTLITTEIKKHHNKKFDVMLEALDKAKGILGKQANFDYSRFMIEERMNRGM